MDCAVLEAHAKSRCNVRLAFLVQEKYPIRRL
jgi:hypothetical protein